MRFGNNNQIALASIVQWNYLRAEGVLLITKDNKISIDLHKIEKVTEKLLKTILILEGEGNYQQTKEFIEQYSTEDEVLKYFYQEMDALPIDIYPFYPKAGETKPFF
jgi:hypothetical protein